jgi:hypothetical protein
MPKTFSEESILKLAQWEDPALQKASDFDPEQNQYSLGH